MNWKITFTKAAEEDLKWLRRHNKKLYVKCFDLLRDAMIDPRDGIGKPERLSNMKTEIWSRRIDSKNRLVYSILEENQEIVVSAFREHYSDH